MKPLFLSAAMVLAACQGAPALPGPMDQLPPGATVVYSNMNGDPVRILNINGCYLTEVLYGYKWVLNNRAFIGSEADASCGEYREP